VASDRVTFVPVYISSTVEFNFRFFTCSLYCRLRLIDLYLSTFNKNLLQSPKTMIDVEEY